MEDSVEKRMQTTAICFGLMVENQTTANLKELKERERFVI
jgi:hypothetical protein